MYYRRDRNAYNTRKYFNMNKYNMKKKIRKKKKEMIMYKSLYLSNYNISCLHSPMVYQSPYNVLRTYI